MNQLHIYRSIQVRNGEREVIYGHFTFIESGPDSTYHSLTVEEHSTNNHVSEEGLLDRLEEDYADVKDIRVNFERPSLLPEYERKINDDGDVVEVLRKPVSDEDIRKQVYQALRGYKAIRAK